MGTTPEQPSRLSTPDSAIFSSYSDGKRPSFAPLDREKRAKRLFESNEQTSVTPSKTTKTHENNDPSTSTPETLESIIPSNFTPTISENIASHSSTLPDLTDIITENNQTDNQS